MWELPTGTIPVDVELGPVGDEWDDADAGVWLHGSRAVVAALDLAVTELLYEVQDTQHRIGDWHRIRLPARDAFEVYLRAVRHELRLQPASTPLFPVSGRQVPAPAPQVTAAPAETEG